MNVANLSLGVNRFGRQCRFLSHRDSLLDPPTILVQGAAGRSGSFLPTSYPKVQFLVESTPQRLSVLKSTLAIELGENLHP